MEHEKLESYKEKLAAELARVEGEIASVAQPSTRTASGWEADLKEADIDHTATESDEKADRYEELEENRDIADALGKRMRELKRALQKIDENSYGVCEVGGEPIEEARLNANPAARTCEKHLEEEANLPQ